MLDAQRRQTDADTAYYRALVEYQLAVKNVQLEKGTLLDYNEIILNEGPWPDKAYADAADREAHRSAPIANPLPWTRGPIVSQGLFPQAIPTSNIVETVTQEDPSTPPAELKPSSTESISYEE